MSGDGVSSRTRHAARLAEAQAARRDAVAAMKQRTDSYAAAAAVEVKEPADMMEAAQMKADMIDTEEVITPEDREVQRLAREFVEDVLRLQRNVDEAARMEAVLLAVAPSPTKEQPPPASQQSPPPGQPPPPAPSPKIVRKIPWQGLEFESFADDSSAEDLLARLRDSGVSPLLSGLSPAAMADPATVRRALLAMTDDERAAAKVRFADGHRGGGDDDAAAKAAAAAIHPVRGRP